MQLFCEERVALIGSEHITLARPRTMPIAAIEHGGEPVAALAGLLAQAGGGAKGRGVLSSLRRLHVLLGHPWLDAAILPWQDGLVAGAAWQAYARVVLAEHGVKAPEGLNLCIEAAGYGRSRLCVGVRAEWVGALAAASEGAGWRMASCRDIVSASAARHVGRVGGNGTLALLEPGTLTCLFRANAQWQDLATLRLDAGQSLPEALDTLAVLSGHAMDDGIHVAGCVPSGVASNNRWTCVGSPDRRWDGVPA
ncbi:hypothetical protein [Burkholderia sp. IDO3]|uniref:hypothetical protein n=1 Tax=Burkholderia sp. IDO3 TaxID=1705310 RepID=UPI001178C797|nr:hypothetical protein [Burkholderia sp. IDO3]